MLFPAMSNFSNQDSSLCPAYALTFLLHLSEVLSFLTSSNGRQTVGDGAFTFDNEPSVLAVCHLQGTDDMYYYSTTFSGGPGVCGRYPLLYHLFFLRLSFYSGAFDVPKAKCPPDRGSLDCVTGSPASSLFSSHLTDWPSSPSSPASTNSIIYNSQATIPRAIPRRNHSTSSTPPLTPDNGSDYLKGNDSIQGKDALDFLMTVFPHQGMSVLPHAKSVSISAPNLGSEFNGVVLDIPGSTKTLYVDGKSAKSVSLRER